VLGAGVQAANLKGCGVITMGECWHNNHHAFPESARMGIERNQPDPGFWVISNLQRIGLAWNVGLPREFSEREDLQRIAGASIDRGGPIGREIEYR
jgi:stearoyl-CoA desaturase (delta-9 desaturase)